MGKQTNMTGEAQSEGTYAVPSSTGSSSIGTVGSALVIAEAALDCGRLPHPRAKVDRASQA